MANKLIWLGVIVGSSVGGYAPTLFHRDAFSLWGVLGSTLGGLVGIWAGLRLADRWG
jgi:hypothetical protein